MRFYFEIGTDYGAVGIYDLARVEHRAFLLAPPGGEG
jgi:hypothetical protein